MQNVKNEQWYVKDLMAKIKNGDIIKPKYQRKKKWDLHPKKETNPDVKSYINFLFQTKNSIHAITFGQTAKNNKIVYTNIDGNNRINAISKFVENPFLIFPEYLDELKEKLKNMQKITAKIIDKLSIIFEHISYKTILDACYADDLFILLEEEDFYNEYIENNCDGVIQRFIKNIKKKFKPGDVNFNNDILINVNLFDGYNTDELCKIFEDINKFNSKLTEFEMLASRLYNITDFNINNIIIETNIKEELSLYYEQKRQNEILECYSFRKEDNINAYDLIIGFQNYCQKQYKIIEEIDNANLPVFFKMYKSIYGSLNDESFCSDNINLFIINITKTCEILVEIYANIFTSKINQNLFNKDCQKKITNIRKNKLFFILFCIYILIQREEKKERIINIIEKTILYNFFVGNIVSNEKRNGFRIYDRIHCERGGSIVDKYIKTLAKNPYGTEEILTRELFSELIKYLIEENTCSEEKKKGKHRKNRKFFEKCLLFYYYKRRIPTNWLDFKFSVEHFFPFSSVWKEELDIDRLGNIFPILEKKNLERSNKHIIYYNTCKEKEFFDYIKDIMPQVEVYDQTIIHKEKNKLNIFDNQIYNQICVQNEKKYLDNFIDCLYK